MDFEITSKEKAISDICQVFGIEKLTPFAKDRINDILLKLERNAKWDGITNSNNWIAKVDIATGIRSLTINKDRKTCTYTEVK